MDKTEFASIRKEMEAFEEQREAAIAASRKVIQLSKQVIYALHREDRKTARDLLPLLEKETKNLPVGNVDTDMPEVGRQEFVEAACYAEFVEHDRLPTRKEVGVQWHAYLAGLCDLSGELVRRAVKDVIDGRLERAGRIHKLVEELYGAFLLFDLRNGELRKKADSLRWNLKRLEDVMYDIKLKGRFPPASPHDHEDGA